MIISYFDNSIYHHIYKRYISEADINLLYSAVKSNKITIYPSLLNIEEIYSALKNSPDIAKAKIKIMLELCNYDKIIESPWEILIADIDNYANGKAPCNPFVRNPEPVIYNLHKMLTQTETIKALYLPAISETKRLNDNYEEFIINAKQKTSQISKKLKHKTEGFEDFWNYREYFAEKYLPYQPGMLEKCKQRGISGLMEIRSVRMYIGGRLSANYAFVFEGLGPKKVGIMDLRHAICSTVAEIFVMEDRTFEEKILQRIPIDNYRVMKLREFLEIINKN